MKRMFIALSVVALIAVVYLAIMNHSNYINVNYMYNTMLDVQSKLGLTDNSGMFFRTIRLSSYTIIVLLAGLFVGAGTVYMFLSASKDKVKAYQRELERTSISGSANASRVEVLEAKIKTLEKAFSAVVDERTKLEVQIKNLNAEIDNLNK